MGIKRRKQHDCTICLEPMYPGDDIIQLPCLHQFHTKTCAEWIRDEQKCPLCKLDLHPNGTHRTLRFKISDITVMTVKELKYLCYYIGIDDAKLQGAVEKKDVAKVILTSRQITIICPEQEKLMEMSIKQLRQILQD